MKLESLGKQTDRRGIANLSSRDPNWVISWTTVLGTISWGILRPCSFFFPSYFERDDIYCDCRIYYICISVYYIYVKRLFNKLYFPHLRPRATCTLLQNIYANWDAASTPSLLFPYLWKRRCVSSPRLYEHFFPLRV